MQCHTIKTKENFMKQKSIKIIISSVVLLTLFGCFGKDLFFLERMNEIEASDKVAPIYYGSYAASSQSLDNFLKRMNEIESSDAVAPIVYGAYAGSTHNLNSFLTRMKEIEASDKVAPIFYGFYASSKHKLTK
jgi:endonuclease IV